LSELDGEVARARAPAAEEVPARDALGLQPGLARFAQRVLAALARVAQVGRDVLAVRAQRGLPAG